jgi:hypothetical protein
MTCSSRQLQRTNQNYPTLFRITSVSLQCHTNATKGRRKKEELLVSIAVLAIQKKFFVLTIFLPDCVIIYFYLLFIKLQQVCCNLTTDQPMKAQFGFQAELKYTKKSYTPERRYMRIAITAAFLAASAKAFSTPTSFATLQTSSQGQISIPKRDFHRLSMIDRMEAVSEFELQVGRAIDTLRSDYPDMLKRAPGKILAV